MANRVDQIDAYVKELGIEAETLAAAIKYAQWSAAAEYRLLASAGIRVDEISFDDLEPFLGRGRMPVLQNVLLSDLLDLNKHNLEQVAWSQQQDDAYGCDRFVLMASVLRQIYNRYHQGRAITAGERKVARDLLQAQDTDRDMLNLISRMAVLVAPVTGTTYEEQQASVADFTAKRQLYLETLMAGNLTMEEAGKAAAITEGMLRLLQLRHKKLSRERFGAYLITSIDDGGGKVHRWLKGDQQPDALYSSLFGGITTDPTQVLKEKIKEVGGDLEV